MINFKKVIVFILSYMYIALVSMGLYNSNIQFNNIKSFDNLYYVLVFLVIIISMLAIAFNKRFIQKRNKRYFSYFLLYFLITTAIISFIFPLSYEIILSNFVVSLLIVRHFIIYDTSQMTYISSWLYIAITILMSMLFVQEYGIFMVMILFIIGYKKIMVEERDIELVEYKNLVLEQNICLLIGVLVISCINMFV